MTFEQYQEDVTKKTALVNVIVIGKGKNYHAQLQLDVSKVNTVTAHGTTYQINPLAFFLKRRNFLARKLPRQLEEYTVLFKQGKPEPLLVKKDDKGITSKMLKTARESTVAKKAMEELLAASFTI